MELECPSRLSGLRAGPPREAAPPVPRLKIWRSPRGLGAHLQGPRRVLVTLILAVAFVSSLALGAPAEHPADGVGSSSEGDATDVRDARPQVRGTWLVLQAIPSPGLAFGERGVHGTMTWQVTPLLYSWSLDRRLSPLRFFVVEPLVRQSGSVELFVSPEYVGRGLGEANYGFRAGARAYFPLTERGDGLSFSLGASARWFVDEPGVSFDVGLYTLFGGLGLLVTVSPGFEDNLVQSALRIRYF